MTTHIQRWITSIGGLFPTLLLAVSVVVQVNPSRCEQANGSVIAIATGGVPPYSFSWSTGATGPSISGLLPGEYTVIVTDGLSETDQATATVNSLPYLATPYPAQLRHDCDNACTGWASVDMSIAGGTAPYTIDFPFPQEVTPNYFWLAGICGNTQTDITFQDAMGCPGTMSVWITGSSTGSPTISGTTPSCGSTNSGAITMALFGGSYAAFRVTNATFDQVYEFNTPGPWTITGLPSGTFSVYLWDVVGPPWGGPSAVYCTDAAIAVVGSLPEPCGSVSGRVYHDANQDCSFNGFDLAQPYRVIAIDPIGAFGISDGTGSYQQNLGFGDFSLVQQAVPNETPICPVSSPVLVTIDANTSNVFVDFANLSTVPHDISVSLNSSSARPGFPTQVWMTLQNHSAFPSGSVDVDLSFDALLTGPSPANGQWSVGVIPPYGQTTVHFSAAVPANINLLGTMLNYAVTVTNSSSEVNTTNNASSLDVTIISSYDPNDKRGTTSSRSSDEQYFLDLDDFFDFTVRFQNTGTAAAETVVIGDVIDPDLDILTLEILGASHAFVPSFGEGRELVFTFDGIDLPDSTTDLLGSQGFISYRVKPNTGIMVGDEIENTAHIFFDFNPAIITNTTSHLVDFSTGIQEQAHGRLQLVPNPAKDRVTITSGNELRRMRLVAMDGRVIMEKAVRGKVAEVDVMDLRGGGYVIEITDANGRLLRERFIKQ